MKTKTVLPSLLLAGMLASGAVPATPRDRGADTFYGNAPHMVWQQRENRTEATPLGIDSQLFGEQSKNRSDVQAYHSSVQAAARSGSQLMLNVYALGCVIYLAFIFLLGLFVGFNELDRDT